MNLSFRTMNKLYFIVCTVLLLVSCEAILFEEDISDSSVIVLAPLHNSVVETSNVNFNWTAVEDADNYQLQIAVPDFVNATQILTDSILPETSYSLFMESSSYQWRVRALNENSETIYTTVSFTVQPEIFDEDISEETVSLIAPTDNATLGENPIVFSWEEVPFTESYVLQIATPNFDNAVQIVVDETLNATTSSQTLDNGEYEWRIKAQNSVSETLYTTASFNVAIESTGDISDETVILTAPSDNSILETNSIIFTWEIIEFAEEYVLQIATPDFENATQVIVDETLAENSSTQTLEDGAYQWRVKAINSTSETAYSTNTLTVNTQANFPDREVIIISPPDNFVSNAQDVNIQWQAVEDATLYRIQIIDPADSSVISEQTITAISAIVTFPEGEYVWQVRAENATENTQYTSQNIIIDSVAPNTPVLLSPLDEEVITSTSVDFTWSREALEGTIESDRIYIYEDEALSILVLEEEVSGGSFNTTLINNETYYWLMNAFDEAGNQSEDSAVFNFTIIE